MKLKMILSLVGVLGLAACGGSSGGNPASTPNVNPQVGQIDGTYIMTDLACSSGDLSPQVLKFKAEIIKANDTEKIVINGKSVKTVSQASANCVQTSNETIQKMEQGVATLLAQEVTCSAGCTPQECEAKAATNVVRTSNISQVGSSLRLSNAEAVTDNPVCDDKTAKTVMVYTRT